MKKRLVGIFLVLAMLLNTLPGAGMAAAAAPASPADAGKSAALAELSELTGGRSAEAYATLQNLGLLDAQGRLNVNQSILLDGKSRSLDEVMKLLDDPSADLSRVAQVGGTPIALGDLKTMVGIERELGRIQETYFAGKAFTPGQLAQLDDLLAQIETEGISAKPMSAQGSGLVLTVTPDAGTGAANPQLENASDYTNASTEVKRVFNLTLSGTIAANDVFSFSWKMVKGLLPDGFFKAQLELHSSKYNQLKYPAEDDPFTFGPDVSSFFVEDPSQFSGTLTITFKGALDSQLGFGINGNLRGFIEFYDAKGLAFSTGSDSFTLPVRVNKPDAFAYGGTWITSMAGVSNYDRQMTAYESYDEHTNPRWDLIDFENDTMMANYAWVQATAREIYTGSSPKYRLDASLSLYNGTEGGYMLNALPVGFDGASPRNRLTTISYEWNDKQISLSSNPLRTVGGETPFVSIGASTPPAGQSVSIVMESVSDGRAPIQLDTIWPGNPTFNTKLDGTGNAIVFYGAGKQRTVSSSISVYDDTAPALVSVDVPAGTYSTGQYVPILLTFSEPVIASGLSLTINGSDLAASELLMDTTGRKAVAMYRVKDVDDTKIVISKVTNLNDLTGNNTEKADNSRSFPDVILKSVLMKNAVTAISVVPATVEPKDLASGVTVTLDLNQDPAYRTKYAAYNASFGKAPFAIKLTNQTTGESRMVDTGLSEPEGIVSAVAEIKDLPPAAADVIYLAEIIAYEGPSDPTGTLVIGKSASFTVKGVTFVNGVSVTYPPDDKTELSLTDSYRPKLGVAFDDPQPTYTTGTWSSSNPDVATIDVDGHVVLTGTAVGKVSFTFKADDGGLTDPDNNHVKTCASKEYTVVAGDSPALVIPAGADSIVARQNQPAEVRWSSNAAFFAPDFGFEFTVELFEGNFAEADLAGKTPAYTAKAPKTANSLTIPEDTLKLLSTAGAPAYTVRISMPHPKLPSETLSAVSHIVVNPGAVVPHLARPSSLYLLDSSPVQIDWSIDGYTEGDTSGDLHIERISTQNGQDVTSTVANSSITAATGSYTLTPALVSGLKDTYMVSLRAKNSVDEGYSSDSFPLYVYNADALELEVNDQKVTSLTMDNEAKVSSPPTSTTDILALREELALIEYIGINYKVYSWSQLKDGIKWSTSDTNTVSINYRQGGLYEDISKFSLDTYLPETKMALSSVTDGTATITATHANTGMKASVTVDVHTLREKFYLFQLTPMQESELSYTDGKGVKKTVATNSEGVLALYEPEGIASDVQLKATGGDGSVWLGTIYRDSLLSGERDATRLQLYPLNTFKLRQAAKVEIYLKKPDGSPYTDGLTLRGGVYKNGGYCQDAKMLGNGTSLLLDGKADQPVTTGADGKLTVTMDSTQFWSQEKGENSSAGTALKPTDDLQYIFELTDISGYYPLLVYSNGNLTPDDLVRSAGSVVTVESYSGEPRAFISNQTVDYGLSGGRLVDVRHSTGHIGPNETYPNAKLLTTVMLWGEGLAASDYRLELSDEYGTIPAAQSSQWIEYPFSSMPVVRNTLILSEATITTSGWIAAGKDAGLKARLSRAGAMLLELPVSPRVVDLTHVPKLTESEDVKGILVNLQKSSGTAATSMSGGDAIINTMMGLMGNLSGPVNGTNFKMIISPGEDNATFKAFIWAGYDSLGLNDVDYSQSGLFVDTKLAEGQLNVGPSLNDLTDMAKGSYNPSQTMNEADKNKQAGKANKSVDFGGQLEGYFEAQIQYNFELGKWEIYVLGGGFTAGFGVGVTFNVNAQAGPVPVTAEFGFGGSVQLDFKAAIRYGETAGLEWASTITANSVNDYLTTLRIDAYVNAFGGVGFDYSVLALKVGLFGKLSVDSQNKFLSRTYLAKDDEHQLNGQGVQVAGEVGIKFVAKFLFISYECVLASVQGGFSGTFNNWAKITDYWNNTGNGLKMASLAASRAGSGLAVVSSTATLESRAYLDRFARSWGTGARRMSLFSLDSPSALEPLQSNAYPYAFPLVSDDGQLLLYAFDNNSANVADTRIYATRLSGGSYPQGSAIAAPSGFEGYGDSGLSLAGSASFAAAAWVRQSASLPDKTGGETLSTAEQALLMNGTEIVTAIYNGTTWTAARLTNNAAPDLAPAVATNGSTAIVAWRSVYSGSSEDLINFSSQDDILYSIYSGGSWSAPKQLYNGTSGAVKGIEAAMLSDGTAAVAYTLDTDSADKSSADYEIGYGIVNDTGEPASSAIITQDKWLDENPQIAAVKFTPSDERFVLGWHSLRDGLSDIRLAAIDGTGALSNSFVESITQAASGNAVDVGGDFRFARMAGDVNNIANLSILWPETRMNDARETDHGILRAVKFTKDGNDLRISAALDVAELPARTLLDHFDAYVSSTDGKTVKAVIQGSEYKAIDLNDPSTYTIYKDQDGNDVYVANEEVKLFTATATYENRVRVDALVVDYANLSLNTLTPIQFTVFNAGMDPIDSVTIKVEGEPTTFDGLNLYPNGSKTLTVWYPMGDTIKNLGYTLTADFGGATDSATGTVYLDYPDLGISQFKVTSEDKGIRTLQLTLYNGSPATLAGGKNRGVRLGFYDDALFKNIQNVTSNTPGVAVNADKTLSISGEDALKLIDQGAFTLEVSFNIGSYVSDAGGQEIPDAGIPFYVNAWAEETNTGVTSVLPEYTRSNNSASVLFESGLARTGQLVSLSVEQGLSGSNKTTANVSLRNNSLRGRTSGNLIVSLLDGRGNVLERQQTYTGDNGLVVLSGEETSSRNFTFGQGGNRVTATYGDLKLTGNSAKLSALAFEGLAVRLSDFDCDKAGNCSTSAPDTTAASTMVSFMAEDPAATVTVNGRPATGSQRVGLPTGKSSIRLEVTAAGGATRQSYVLSVNRVAAPQPPQPWPPSYPGVSQSYRITTAPADHGSVSTSPAEAMEGTSVTISVVPDDGYALDDLVVTGAGGQSVAVSRIGDGQYAFTMPGGSVTVTATFWENPFGDVGEADWFYNAVKYASKHGLMQGVGGGNFAPSATMTRAMAVTILYRLEGAPAPAGANPFNDVQGGAWYTDATLWAAEKGLVSGYGDGRFGPADPITREQLAVILYQYAKFKGIAPTGAWSVELKYLDKDGISAWAKEAASYCQLQGLIQGDGGGNFNPQNGTLRSEAAMILMRFVEAMK